MKCTVLKIHKEFTIYSRYIRLTPVKFTNALAEHKD